MAKSPEKFEPQESEELEEQSVEQELDSQQEKEYVSYLGVRLEKAENRENAPDPEKYADYIEDEFSLELQRDIAVSFEAGDPILIEGGTTIGKTTTVKKMASDLGWELHYTNLNGATDVEDIMGRYIPNPFKVDREKLSDEQYEKILEKWGQLTSGMDPELVQAQEFMFADGSITSGLRQEEGKIKIIVVDEYNSAAPNIIIRLHEVLDALERGGEVVLTENASARIPVDKTKTKIIALTNPPGKGYFGREPIDPAQLRRWVYKKAPSALPDKAFSHSVDALFGVDKDIVKPAKEKYINSLETELTHEQLEEIQGLEEILELYKEFHHGAKALVTQRQIGEDQPQPFTYDDRMEPRRVMDFVRRYYNNDITETFQNALRYYYINKLESDEDKEKMEELVRMVKYTGKSVDTKRISIEDLDSTEGEVKTERLEDEALDMIEKYMKDNPDYEGNFAVGMAGMDSERAWDIREELRKYPDKLKYIPYSLAGLDSVKIEKLLDYLSSKGKLGGKAEAISYSGVDRNVAWDWRHNMFDVEKYEMVAYSLMGIDSETSWNMRDRFILEISELRMKKEEGLAKKLAHALSESLIGLDSKRAWNARDHIQRMFGSDVGESIVGLNSKKAWEVRKELFKKGGKKEKLTVLDSLMGLDSDAAWEIRESLLEEGGYEKAIAHSLAGLTSERAVEMRGMRLHNKGVNEEDIIIGISGDYRMEAVRRLKESEGKGMRIIKAGDH